MKIFTFAATGDIFDAKWFSRYDEKDCPDGIAYGDVVVVESEGVVGVVAATDFAVTAQRGNLPKFIMDGILSDPQELKNMVDAIVVAIAEAERLGFEVNPALMCFSNSSPPVVFRMPNEYQR